MTSDPIGLQGGLNTFAYVEGNPLINKDVRGLSGESIYDPVSNVISGEAHFLVGGGFAIVTCQDECKRRRTMKFVKVCVGLAAGVNGSAGFVGGVDGKKCKPSTYAGIFGELGASWGLLGGFIDIGNGVVETGPSFGGGAQMGVCYYVYVGDE